MPQLNSGRSQHKEVKRECPSCHLMKLFPSRNETCSPKCASRLALTRGASPSHGQEVQEVAGNSWSISLPRTRIGSLDELIAFYRVNLDEWEVERFVANKWEVGRSGKSVNLTINQGVMDGKIADSGDIFIEPLYQVKAFFRRKSVQIGVREELASMKAEYKADAPKWKAAKRPKYGESGNMLELSIPDLHIGKMAWGKETGHEDYDVKIAEKIFGMAVETLVERTSSHRYDEIVLVVGNDLLNSDNVAGTTTMGTPQDNDSRYYKTFKIAREMMTRAIERLRLIAPVRVIVAPGNHDELTAWHIGDSLECYFHGAPDVIVENSPTPRKYYQWGSVMLIWSHKKFDDPAGLIGAEQPKMFGNTRFREIHTGDQHAVRLEEKHGIRFRILPALTVPDRWHSGKGFVGNIRSAEAYVWNKTEGLIGTATFSAPVLSDN